MRRRASSSIHNHHGRVQISHTNHGMLQSSHNHDGQLQDGSGTPLAVDGVGVGLAGGVGVGEAAAPAPGGSVVGVGIGAGVADAVGGTAVGGTVVASITANVAAMSGVDVGKNVGCGMGTNVGCGVDVDANVGVGVRVGCGVGVDVACCAWSSSVIVSIVLIVARSSMPSAALPDTVSFRSGSSLLLSTAVMIQVPMLDIMPGGMVNVLPDTVTNSGSSDDIYTVIVVGATEAVSSVAVTVRYRRSRRWRSPTAPA